MDRTLLVVGYVLSSLDRPVAGFSELAEIMFFVETEVRKSTGGFGLGLDLSRSRVDGLVEWNVLEPAVNSGVDLGLVTPTASHLDDKGGYILIFRSSADKGALRRLLVDVLGDQAVSELDSAVAKVSALNRDQIFELAYSSTT